MKIAITHAYVPMQSTHAVWSTKKEAYPRYRTAARPTVASAKMYAPAASARSVFEPAGRDVPAMSATMTNQITPPSATGMPLNVPKRLKYACEQLKVELMSQMLSYVGSVNNR